MEKWSGFSSDFWFPVVLEVLRADQSIQKVIAGCRVYSRQAGVGKRRAVGNMSKGMACFSEHHLAKAFQQVTKLPKCFSPPMSGVHKLYSARESPPSDDSVQINCTDAGAKRPTFHATGL